MAPTEEHKRELLSKQSSFREASNARTETPKLHPQQLQTPAIRTRYGTLSISISMSISISISISIYISPLLRVGFHIPLLRFFVIVIVVIPPPFLLLRVLCALLLTAIIIILLLVIIILLLVAIRLLLLLLLLLLVILLLRGPPLIQGSIALLQHSLCQEGVVCQVLNRETFGKERENPFRAQHTKSLICLCQKLFPRRKCPAHCSSSRNCPCHRALIHGLPNPALEAAQTPCPRLNTALDRTTQ